MDIIATQICILFDNLKTIQENPKHTKKSTKEMVSS